MSDAKGSCLLNSDQVRAFLPHRQPFLLIDRVLEIQHVGPKTSLSPKELIGTKVVALKNITYNETVFAGHFPDYSIFPGVLLIETMAQATSFTLFEALKGKKSEEIPICVLVGVDECRFRRPVTPGDALKITTEVTGGKGPLWTFDCSISVEGQVVAQAKIMAQLGPRPQTAIR